MNGRVELRSVLRRGVGALALVVPVFAGVMALGCESRTAPEPSQVESSSTVVQVPESFALDTGPPLTAAERVLAETARRAALRAQAVLDGTVVELQVHDRGPDGEAGLHTHVTLELRETLRGETSTTFWFAGGETPTRRRVVSGQPNFKIGERVVVFVARRSRGSSLWADGPLAKWSHDGDRAERHPVGHDSLPGGSLQLSALRRAVGGRR